MSVKLLLRDIGIIIFLMAVSFFVFPQLINHLRDAWLLWPIFVSFMVYVGSLFIELKYFSMWIVIAAIGIMDACEWGHQFFMNRVVDITISQLALEGIPALIFSMPLALVVYFNQDRKYSLLLLLIWPLAIWVGLMFAFEKEGMAAIGLQAIAGMWVFLATKLYAKAGKRGQSKLRWSSVAACFMAGVFPSFLGMGWKYAIFTTILPPIAVYFSSSLWKR